MDSKDIFLNNVCRIIIESYNLCNRKCSMCPQSLGIRDEKFEAFPEELFIKLISELKSINYSRWIAFGRYHEPLLFSELTLSRIGFLHKELPNANIMINTNGDFIDRELLAALSKSGVKELKIMRYQGGVFSDRVAEDLCNKMIDKLDLKIVNKHFVSNVITKYECENICGMAVTIKSENYNDFNRGCNRGGLIGGFDQYDRTIRCDVPVKNIDIDYNGCILPCNNLLSDAPSHKCYVLGNLRDMTIFDAYVSGIKSSFVKRIYNNDFSKDEICQHCTYFYDTSKENINYIL